jgi:hypothetical protein
MELSGQLHAPGIHWIGGWVGPITGLDDVEKTEILTLPGLELRPLGHPSRSQSLYRLRYPGIRELNDVFNFLKNKNNFDLISGKYGVAIYSAYILLARPESRKDKLRWFVDGIASGLCPVLGVGTAIGWC